MLQGKSYGFMQSCHDFLRRLSTWSLFHVCVISVRAPVFIKTMYHCYCNQPLTFIIKNHSGHKLDILPLNRSNQNKLVFNIMCVTF